MSEEQPSNSEKEIKSQRSWVERLGQALQGELKDREQLTVVLNEALKNNIIDQDAFSMIDGALQVAEMQVRDIMLPRSQMVVLEMNSSEEELMDTVIVSAHSRFPVVADSKDEIVGILLAKDLLPHLVNDKDNKLNVRDVLRPAVFVPESKRLNVLLKEFRSTRNHIAIVVDEYGGVAGMVTIEDVLEQIVGEIEDEHDTTDLREERVDERHFLFSARLELDYINENYKLELPVSDEFETLGGLLVHTLGEIPEKEVELTIEPYKFTVLEVSNTKIDLVSIELLEEQ